MSDVARGFSRASATVAHGFSRACALALVIGIGLAAAPSPVPVATAEAATARYFASIRNQPSLLLAFLREMPKGGDLHNHLSGAIYAESFIQWTAEQGGCLDTSAMALVDKPCDGTTKIPAANVIANAGDGTYGRAIDAMSMRNWNPALNGHDHFFATFGKFGPGLTNPGNMLAEVARRAHDEHVGYLELMATPTGPRTAALAGAQTRPAGWDPDRATRLREALLAAGFRDAVVRASRVARSIGPEEAREAGLLRCGTPQADAWLPHRRPLHLPGERAPAPRSRCSRRCSPASRLPRPTRVSSASISSSPKTTRPPSATSRSSDADARLPARQQYPTVKITLHAGELTDGLVPPETLRSHIRASIEEGGAVRIGHGVDVMREDDPIGLLREMAAKKVLVEIALTSNDVILGVKGPRHPLAMYLKYGVPVALVTDDAGVSRSSMTLEYLKAVQEQGLDYMTLKRMARNSIAYAFAQDADKAALRASLDAAFTAFERRTPVRP